MLAVRSLSNHSGLHIGGVVRVHGPYFLDGHQLARPDKGLGIGIGEEEQHIRVRPRFKIREHLVAPLFTGS